MSLIIAGTVRVAEDAIARLRPHMLEMLAASRAEDGCVEYCYAQDMADPELVRIFEVWRDQDALDAHFKSEHMARWRAAGAGIGISDRRLFAYDCASQRPL